MSKLKVFLTFCITSLLIFILETTQGLGAFTFATSFWFVNIAGVVAALIGSKSNARRIFFIIIGLNFLGAAQVAYVALTNPEAPIVGLALVALVFNVNVWLAAMGATAAPHWQKVTRYTKSENRTNWTKIDEGEDPTL